MGEEGYGNAFGPVSVRRRCSVGLNKYISWLFRRLNLNLRAEIIINISLLMLAAILLIGFSISKISEKNIVQERIKTSEKIVRDFQWVMDFLTRNTDVSSLRSPGLRKMVQDLAEIYTRQEGLSSLLITDRGLNTVASGGGASEGSAVTRPALEDSIRSGQMSSEIKKSGTFLSTRYERIILHAPLWIEGKIAGGIQMEVPVSDLMATLMESKRIILISIILDGAVLIVFGSFLLSRVLVSPLRDLVQLTQRISEGDFNQEIKVTSKNEIGQLISSFNRMVARLKENQEHLETYVESLESANQKLKQAREELIRTEKLASIGRFAAGVAHEVGNPLGAILGYTSILEKDGVEREEAKDYLRRIESEIERINRIVRELLDFARPSKFEIRALDLNRVVGSTLSLLSHQKNFRNIETQVHLQSDLPSVKADESQLSQVLINIILNAVDAMPKGGTLKIQTSEYRTEDLLTERLQRMYAQRRKEDPVTSDYSQVRKHHPLSTVLAKFPKGTRLAKTEITDTGIGISSGDMEKIFDPFFTTKAPDKGTGLGLSISLRIIESMGGEIRVESQPGKGSTFEVYLPIVLTEEKS
jgi:two-component system, NtrC family, sensor kinase